KRGVYLSLDRLEHALDEGDEFVGGLHRPIGVTICHRIQDRQMAIDRGVQSARGRQLRVVNPADPTKDGVQRAQRVLEERLASRRQDELVDAAVHDVEDVYSERLAPFPQQTRHMEQLITMA